MGDGMEGGGQQSEGRSADYLEPAGDVFANNEVVCELGALLWLEILGEHNDWTRIDPVGVTATVGRTR